MGEAQQSSPMSNLSNNGAKSGKVARETLRGIALFEAAKGLLVLSAGFGLLSLLHRDVEAVATRLINHLHLQPGRKFVGVFINAASQVTDKELLALAVVAFIYSAFRLVEGYGLWRERAWAEWLALISGMIYLPIEIYKVAAKLNWAHVSVLVVNLLVVGVVARVMWCSRSSKEERGIILSEPESSARKNLTADWLAWFLQFIFGAAVGFLMGYVVISRHTRYNYYSGGRCFLLQPSDVIPFLFGASIWIGAIASHFGDRLWVAYRIFPNDKVPQSKFGNFCSIVVGMIGVGLMVVAVMRTFGWVG